MGLPRSEPTIGLPSKKAFAPAGLGVDSTVSQYRYAAMVSACTNPGVGVAGQGTTVGLPLESVEMHGTPLIVSEADEKPLTPFPRNPPTLAKAASPCASCQCCIRGLQMKRRPKDKLYATLIDGLRSHWRSILANCRRTPVAEKPDRRESTRLSAAGSRRGAITAAMRLPRPRPSRAVS